MSLWTNEHIKLLDRLWNQDGFTASRCAYLLGPEFTRNSVIGKVHRLGFPKRGKPRPSRAGVPWSDAAKARAQKRMAERQARASKKVNPTVARIKAPPVDKFKPDPEALAVGAWNALPDTTPIGMMDLTATTCRWPIGDGPPFLFCGCAVAEGSSYCPTHKHIGTGKGTVGEQNAVKAAQSAAKQDRRTRDWLEAA
jgi:GcrA cell cycle regulator